MSLGFALGEIIGLTQLAWKIFQDCSQACGEHEELTREVGCLHSALHRLEQEVSIPDSILTYQDERSQKELKATVEGCQKVLNVLNCILKKYNALSDKERKGKKLWSKIRFGNGEMQDLSDLRTKLLTYTTLLTLQLNLCSMSSQGRVERQIATQGGDLREMKESIEWITAAMLAGDKDSSLTSYDGDDKEVWKDLRRELVKEGFSSSNVTYHRHTIMDYIRELGDRGVLDEIPKVNHSLPGPPIADGSPPPYISTSASGASATTKRPGSRKQKDMRDQKHLKVGFAAL